MRAIGSRCVHADPVPNAAVLVQLLGTVASEPSSSIAGLGLKQVSLPTVMLGVGLIFLVTLTISRFTPKFGLPAILGVLLFGLLLPAHLNPLSVERISHLQTVNLAMLLFYAGLSTDLRQIRSFLGYGLLLSLGGVVVTTLVLGMCIWFLSSPTASSVQLGTSQIPLVVGMLVASCLASTDAGATLSVLKQVRHHVPEKLRDLLEFESALNDPAAILMLSLMLGLASLSGAQRAEGVLVDQLRLFIQALGSGVLVGVLVGCLAVVLNLLIQGVSLPLLCRRLGLGSDEPALP
jgi:cell volume regulation protein A